MPCASSATARQSTAACGSALISIRSLRRSAAAPARSRPISSVSACSDSRRTDVMPQLSTKITFTEEQTMLLDTATAFFREKSPTATVRRQIASESGVDRELWSEIAELGWLGIAVPERFGGSGLSLADVTVIVEPMGRHLAGTPFVSTQLFTQALLAGGSDQQQRDILPKICGGSIGSVALFESDGDWNLDHLECAAVIAGDAARLSGTKTLVCDAAAADFVLASVSLDGPSAAGIVKAADLPRKTRETVIDETRRAFSLDLNGVNVQIGRASCR